MNKKNVWVKHILCAANPHEFQLQQLDEERLEHYIKDHESNTFDESKFIKQFFDDKKSYKEWRKENERYL